MQTLGFEQLVQLSRPANTSNEDAFKNLGSSQINIVTIQSLDYLQRYCQRSRIEKENTPKNIFVNLEKDSLTDPLIIEKLTETQRVIHENNYCLCVEVVERPLSNSKRLGQYIDGLCILSDNNILISLDDYNLGGPHLELKLGLCALVKLDINDLMIPKAFNSLNSATKYYRDLREELLNFAAKYKVKLLAEKVETNWQFEILQGMPFFYFQGYLFGKPHAINIENYLAGNDSLSPRQTKQNKTLRTLEPNNTKLQLSEKLFKRG